MTNHVNARDLLGEVKFYESYARYNDELNRYETWSEAVTRVMNMHRVFYKDKMTQELSDLIDETEYHYKNKRFVGAQRALQFGGDQILKNNMKMYNCVSTYADRVEFFGELLYVLLCGCGAGFSVQKHHVAKLPMIRPRNKQPKLHVIEDSIEGWATSLDVLMSSYFIGGGKHPEYEGRRVYFDSSKVRPKGAYISGGFKAPGPEPLILALNKIEKILNDRAIEGFLRPIDCYDIIMHTADATLSGGVRRSATICLFSIDDEEMLTAKTGDWYLTNPQRGRSNNSAICVRNQFTREQFDKIIESVKGYGEPGFLFVESSEHTTNPCVEIGMLPVDETNGKSGFEGCNLTSINGSLCKTKEDFFIAAKYAAVLGTLQAGYTNFKFLGPETKRIFEREALLGVSLTGWMNSPKVLLDAKNMQEAAKIVLDTNEKVAKIIGINPSARTTCVKPEGSTSVVLGSASGIHGEHSNRYLRHMQANKEGEIVKAIKQVNPYMVEESVWNANGSDWVIAFPIINDDETIFREDLYGVNLLEKIKLVQENWVEYGTRVERCVDPTLRHNVSNTVSVRPHEWNEVADFIWNNRRIFSGISLLSGSGDKDYAQAPMTEVLTEQEILDKYGVASIFASGLIVDSVKGFKNLWEACQIAQMENCDDCQETFDNRADWIRRFKKFADNYFDGDMKKTEYLMKDVYLLHKWTKIQQTYVPVDFSAIDIAKKYVDVDTTGSAACVGTKDGEGCAI